MSEPLNSQIKSMNNRRCFIDSASLCSHFLEQLLMKTYEGVGLQNAKKMAPQNTNLQTIHIIKSFVSQGFAQKNRIPIILKDERDPKPAQIDNISVQQIQTEKGKASELPPIVQQTINTKSSRFKNKRQTTQKSIRSRKFTQIDETAAQNKLKAFSNFQKLQQSFNEFDFSQDPELNKVRNTHLNIERQNLKREEELQKIRQKNLVEKQKGQKIVKDMKKVTFDYQGKLFGQGNGVNQPEKLMHLNNKFGNIKKFMMISDKIQKTTIDTNKKKDLKQDRKDFKQAPLFREQAQSIIQNIQHAKGIAAGVKIVQDLGQNKSVTKQNPLKKPNNHSLADFKNNSKLSKFKEYHPVSLGRQKSNLNFSSLNNQQTSRSKPDIFDKNQKKSFFNKQFKSKSSYSLNQAIKNRTLDHLDDYQSADHSILGSIDEKYRTKPKAEYRGLPFIKSKGYKAIDIASQKSFKLVMDEKNQNSKQKLRSRIFINDLSLLKTTLQDL